MSFAPLRGQVTLGRPVSETEQCPGASSLSSSSLGTCVQGPISNGSNGNSCDTIDYSEDGEITERPRIATSFMSDSDADKLTPVSGVRAVWMYSDVKEAPFNHALSSPSRVPNFDQTIGCPESTGYVTELSLGYPWYIALVLEFSSQQDFDGFIAEEGQSITSKVWNRNALPDESDLASFGQMMNTYLSGGSIRLLVGQHSGESSSIEDISQMFLSPATTAEHLARFQQLRDQISLHNPAADPISYQELISAGSDPNWTIVDVEGQSYSEAGM